MEPTTGGVLRTGVFGCETGFAFEVGGESARCRRAASVVVAPLADCPQVGGVPGGATTLSAPRTCRQLERDGCPSASARRTTLARIRGSIAANARRNDRAPSVPVAR